MEEVKHTRNNPRKLKNLTKAHYEEIIGIEHGADIMGYMNAKRLREVEATEPSFIVITEVMGDYDGAGQLPYFGAIATKTGLLFARRRLRALAKAGAA